MPTPNFEVTLAAPKRARVEIYDYIGPSWAGMIDAKLVARKLSEVGQVDEIELHVNSRGGSGYEGLAIASILRDHPARKIGIVEGIAASAATLPLMVCDSVRIPKNALMMIHDPRIFVEGGESELRAAIEQLAKVKKAGVYLYATKSGKPESEIVALMTAETWYTGDEAVAAKFADATDKELSAEMAPEKEQMSLALKQARGLPGLATIPFLQFEEPTTLATTNEPAKPADNKPAESAPAAPVMTKAEIDQAAKAASAEAVQAERNRTTELASICRLAGKPEKAAEYIASGSTVEQCRKEMYEAVCQERKPSDEGASRQDLPAGADPNAKYKEEYKANPHLAAAMSVEDYVATRRVDDGLDSLGVKPTK